MKVVYIDDNKDDEGNIIELPYYDLTIGKTYDVIKYDWDGYYIIINDTDYENLYPKEWFKTIAEYRNEKIDKLLE